MKSSGRFITYQINMNTIQTQYEYLKSKPSDIEIRKRTEYFWYDVSSYWNIYSLRSWKILKKQVDKWWYNVVNIRISWKVISIKIHRIVAKTFIENIENKLCVNHKDGNKTNNCIENLERATHKENENHARNTLWKKATWTWKFWIDHHKSKTIWQYDLYWNLLKVRHWSWDIQKSLWIPYKYISDYCLWKHKSKKFYLEIYIKWKLYSKNLNILKRKPSDIFEHLQTLHDLASQCDHVTEFGVRTAVSTTALLAWLKSNAKMISYDLNRSQEVVELSNLCKNFQFIVADTREVEIDETDLLFIDTRHVSECLELELEKFSTESQKIYCVSWYNNVCDQRWNRRTWRIEKSNGSIFERSQRTRSSQGFYK